MLDAPAIATGTLVKGDERLKVDVVSLRRASERMVQLDLRVTALTDTLYKLTYYLAPGGNAVDGLALIDKRNAKKYLVVRDSKHVCLCSRGESGLEKHQPVPVYAYFPAPPTSTDAVDVIVPDMSPFDDVPISK